MFCIVIPPVKLNLITDISNQFSDACFTDHQVLNGVTINITMKILTPFHCQYLCGTTAGCVAFNFHKWYFQCTMLSSVSSPGTDPYYLSGYLTNCNGTIGEYNFTRNLLQIFSTIKKHKAGLCSWPNIHSSLA